MEKNVIENKQPLCSSRWRLIKPGAICAEDDNTRQGLLHPSSIMELPDVEEVGAVQRRAGSRPLSVLGAALQPPAAAAPSTTRSQINTNTHCYRQNNFMCSVNKVLQTRVKTGYSGRPELISSG